MSSGTDLLPTASGTRIRAVLAELARPHRPIAVVTLVVLVAGAAVSLLVAPLLGEIVDRVAQRQGAEAVLGPVLGLAAIALVIIAGAGTDGLLAAVTGFSLGVSTAVVWVGVPVLAVTLWAARGVANTERRCVERATGQPLPPHHYRVSRPGSARVATSPSSCANAVALPDSIMPSTAPRAPTRTTSSCSPP